MRLNELVLPDTPTCAAIIRGWLTSTRDGVIFPPGRPIICGRAAIAYYWKLAPGVPVVDHADSIILRGDIACDYGTFRAQHARDGQAGSPGFGNT